MPTESGNPRCLALPSCGVAAAGVLLLAGCLEQEPKTRSDPALMQRALELQQEVYALKKEIALLEEDANQAEPLRGQLAEAVTELDRARLERDSVKTEFQSLQEDYDALVEQLKPIDQLLSSYELKLREQLVGLELGDVELRDGRTFVGVEVNKVEADWVALQHEGGISNIEFNLLPDELQRKFSFRPAMVSTDSLIAQEPVVEESTKPEMSLEDAAKLMQQAMAEERERTKQRQQESYRQEIKTLTGEIALLDQRIEELRRQRAAVHRDVTNKNRRIKIAKADQEKALRPYDYKIGQVQREIAQRKARIEAVKGMLQ